MAAELRGELGEPYGALWRLLVDTHGPREAARVFARVLGAVVDHGEDAVAQAVKAALASNRGDLLELGRVLTPPKPLRTAVPPSLAGYEVEAASVAAYDHLRGHGGADE